jgi:flagellar basal body-associated protein FliL
MKKLIALAAVVITSITMASAGNGKSISSAISKQLNIPATLKNNPLNGKVNVQFKLTSEGKATLVDVKTSDPELKNYIITQFPKIDFDKASADEGMYFIDINFKVL